MIWCHNALMSVKRMNISFPIINPVTATAQALTSWYKHNCTWVIHHPHNHTLRTAYKSCILSVYNKSSYLFLFYLEFISTPRCGSDLVLNANLLQVQHTDMLYNMGGGEANLWAGHHTELWATTFFIGVFDLSASCTEVAVCLPLSSP